MKEKITMIEKVKQFASTKLGVGVIAGVVGIGLGGMAMDTSSIEAQLATSQATVNEQTDKILELENTISTQTTTISGLEDKVEQAKPFFDMKKEEQAELEEKAKKEKEERLAKEEEEKLAALQAELDAKSVELSNGNFISGEDFEEGVYDLIAVKGGGNVSSNNMFSGGINAIMGTANDGFYEKEYKNIKLPAGTELSIKGVTIKLVPKS